jgi:Ssp1 endopeptidase immunity protein Rap1a
MKIFLLTFILIFQLFTIKGIYGEALAATEGLDGNTSLEICKDALKYVEDQELTNQEKINGSYCGGFLLGFYESHLIEQEKLKPKLYCMPNDLKTEQLNRIFVSFLEQHPERLKEESAVLLFDTFKKAYPCKKKE